MQNLKLLFPKLPLKVVGIGVTAFNRCGPSYFLPNYEIICYKNSADVAEIKKKCPVHSIRGDFRSDLKTLNSLEILRHPAVEKYLSSLGKVGLFLYKSTANIEAIADKFGWKIIANRSSVRDPYENKKIFREILKKVGVEPVPGEIFKINQFDEKVFEEMQKKYGPKLVLRLPEVTKGGGRGNTFIDKKEDLPRFWQNVERLTPYFNIQHVIAVKFIKGVSPSITGCATRFGVLTGVVQTQILDIPEVINTQKGGGLFCGHDWSYRHYSDKVQKQAERIARRFGEYLYQKGYRGIFGIDLMVEEKTEKVYPIECNPRYTGAFPVYSMMQMSLGEPSFDVFQLLEHLKIDYQIDFKKIDRLYKQPKEGSQLILYNQTENYLQVKGEIKAGVYQANLKSQTLKLKFIRPGFAYEDIKNDDEFVLTDGVPRRGAVIRPGLRILKIIFPKTILTKDGKSIDRRTKLIVKDIYRRLKLKPKRDWAFWQRFWKKNFKKFW